MNITLKQNEQGETVQITTTTSTQETPLSADVLKQRIADTAADLNNLQKQLQAVQAFESNELIEQEVIVSDRIDKPIVNEIALADVSFIKEKPVIIEDDVHVGANSVIVAGVHIGRRSQIGAGSVVTKDIPSFCVAVGNPAQVIKQYNQQTGLWEKTKH